MKYKKQTTLATINKLRSLLTKRDKIILLILFFATIVYSVIETFSVSIIMPFISFASNPNLITSHSISYEIYTFFGFKDSFEFMIAFSVALIIFYIFRMLYAIAFTYAQNRFAYRKFHFFAYRLFSKAVEINYDDFVKRKLDKIRANITSESLQASTYVQNFLQMCGELFTIGILYVLLLITSWKMTLVLTIIMGLQVFLVMKTLGKKIEKMGQVRSAMNTRFNEIISKTFGNFKIIKLKGNQKQVFEEFEEASIKRTNAEILTQTTLPAPRFLLESLGFSILIGCVAYILVTYRDVDAVLPIISMYALALYRILPAVSRILSTYNLMGYYANSVALVHEDLLYHADYEDNEPCAFEKSIELKGVTFGYELNKAILRDFSLTIHKGDKIAFCGESGAGKSTLVDLIIGIYKPQQGVICIDGKELNNHNLRSWRKKIGYIPQTIYLFDGSVAENVAFGSEMNEDRVIEACKKANIYEFLQEHGGIYTRVGEGGLLLSGGQKQRIGIARAIYDNPEILVLDEATSALDTATEEKIMDEIYDVAQNKTLLVIAHRLNTIERCERRVEIIKQK
ncbi:MAG: ABC transporter ATP-binding protein [Helicobacter sp.]|uniref:ABC transporter ATP-binding protein n=1 Tax=Helicobacter sp. TaxID=218 RepID=UPI003753C757|nr:ABC transporter ATP-binding protein [Helicobacter sp.]